MVWFGQEEIRQNTRDGTSSKGKDEEKFALARKAKKGKGKKSQSKPESSQGGKKKDLSKIKYFHYHEFRHYATKGLHEKESKKTSGGAIDEALASQFKLEFTPMACMESTLIGSVWCLDSGASFHKTWCRDFVNDLEDKDLQMHIEMWENERYSLTEDHIVKFQRDLVSPLGSRMSYSFHT